VGEGKLNEFSMNSSNKKIIAIAGTITVVMSVTLFVAFHRATAGVPGTELPDTVSRPYPADANYRQTGNNCGPYATAAAIRALDGKDSVSSETVVKQMPLRVPGYFTMPLGIKLFLTKRGFVSEMYDTSRLKEDGRTQFLREKLAAGDALILLVGRSWSTQHYITVLGYDRPRDVFFVYNSALASGEKGQTVDSNGAEVGNITMTSQDLLKYWSGGGVFGVYRWTALTAATK